MRESIGLGMVEDLKRFDRREYEVDVNLSWFC